MNILKQVAVTSKASQNYNMHGNAVACCDSVQECDATKPEQKGESR